MSVDHDSDVAEKDGYGNVTANNPDGQTEQQILDEAAEQNPGIVIDSWRVVLTTANGEQIEHDVSYLSDVCKTIDGTIEAEYKTEWAGN